MRDILTPENPASCGITDGHQTEPTSPIGRIHLYADMLVLGYLLNMVHTFQIPADGLLIHTILEGKLTQRLLALYIVGYYLGFIAANTAIKTAATVLAFIPLSSPSQAIVDHIGRAAEKAFF